MILKFVNFCKFSEHKNFTLIYLRLKYNDEFNRNFKISSGRNLGT